MIEINTLSDITNATTKQLVAYYNHYALRPVKKFQDRATAEARVRALHEEQCGPLNEGPATASPDQAETRDPAVPATISAEPPAAPNEQPRRVADTSNLVAAWQRPEVRAVRSRRMPVLANGQRYKSTADAFRALDLPWKDHIRFRGQLRKERECREYGIQWQALD